MALQTNFTATPDTEPISVTEVIELEDGAKTTINYVRYARSAFQAEVVTLPEPTPLLSWCRQNNFTEAINGGFFRRANGRMLGELYIDGQPMPFDQFGGEWHKKRSSLLTDRMGYMAIGSREDLPTIIEGDLLQAGPALVLGGKPTHTTLTCDPEGFLQTADEHDAYINAKRFPRAAIGYNQDHIITLTADGRSSRDAGLYLHELAAVMHSLGADYALNLDGGSSSSHVSGGKLLNRPRTDIEESLHGFPVYNALVLRSIS